MKQHLLEKIIAVSVFFKAAVYKKGSLLAVSAPISVGFYEMFRKLIEGSSYKDITLPIVAVTICLIVFFLFFSIDLIMGLIAAKHEAKVKDWVKSEKLYTSLGKIGGVLLINIIFLGINLFLVALDYFSMAKVITVITVSLNVLAILYEFHSIGENIKRRAGVKPRMFTFFEKMTTILEKKIMTRIVRMLDSKEDDYTE